MLTFAFAAILAAGPRHIESCLDERFLDNDAFAVATPIAGATLMQAEYGQRLPMDPAHHWIAGAHDGDLICVTDGHLFGWTEASNVTLGPEPSPPKSAWIGRWEFAYSGGEPWIDIRQRKDGKLHVTGYAEWRAHPDSVPNLGELDFTGLPHGVLFDDGDPACFEMKWADDEPARCLDCVIRLMLLGDRLLAKDNGRCGGMNVRFSTMFSRRKRAHR